MNDALEHFAGIEFGEFVNFDDLRGMFFPNFELLLVNRNVERYQFTV